jgi:hypothetical protein
LFGSIIGFLIGKYLTTKGFNHLSPDEIMALHFNELYNNNNNNNKLSNDKSKEDYNIILKNDTYDKPIYHFNSDVEINFESTIRSCLGSQCFDESVKEKDGSKNDRIGILAPPGSGGEILLKIINKALIKEKKKNINVIVDTHVPAYGYGKNHGWTRIIRIVRPILLHSMSILNTYTTYTVILHYDQLATCQHHYPHQRIHNKLSATSQI